MLSATRDGNVYRPGDEGFEPAWAANLSDMTREAIAKQRIVHAERLVADPDYRAKHEAFEREYERIFGVKEGKLWM